VNQYLQLKRSSAGEAGALVWTLAGFHGRLVSLEENNLVAVS
jgi:hypothetical protein